MRLSAANDCQDVKPVFAAPALVSSRSLSPLLFSLPCHVAAPISAWRAPRDQHGERAPARLDRAGYESPAKVQEGECKSRLAVFAVPGSESPFRSPPDTAPVGPQPDPGDPVRSTSRLRAAVGPFCHGRTRGSATRFDPPTRRRQPERVQGLRMSGVGAIPSASSRSKVSVSSSMFHRITKCSVLSRFRSTVSPSTVNVPALS